jgi:hypothetical protein
MVESETYRSVDVIGAYGGSEYTGGLRKVFELLGKPALTSGALPVPLIDRVCTRQSTGRNSVSEYQANDTTGVPSTRLPCMMASILGKIGMAALGAVVGRSLDPTACCEYFRSAAGGKHSSGTVPSQVRCHRGKLVAKTHT